MSYQPEERYWTDYLRIALPVVGLLLMLGLFWFWAASLIGDEDDDDPANVAALATETPIPTAVPPVATTEGGAANPPADETVTAEANGNGEDPAADDTNANPSDEDETVAAVDDPSQDGAGTDAESACEPGDFCDGATAVVTSDGVRVRSAPVIDSANIQGVFSEGDEVVVTGEPEESEEITWVTVEGRNAEGEDLEGYVTTEFLQVE